MSQAETLLNELEEVVEEARIIIGSDRRITVPDNLKRIAVQYDHNIETVTFECPRYWDSHDMSTMDIYINYLRADGKPGSFKAENVQTEEGSDIMTFDWTIKNHITQVKGNITFLICIAQEGDDEVHWNSELNKEMYVSEGLEINEAIIEQYPDVITDILLKLGTAVQVPVTVMDEGKFMRVMDGEWAAVEIPYAEEASF